MAGPANAERFVNYITGDPIALADTNASGFGPGYPGLVPPADSPVDPTKFLSQAGWATVQSGRTVLTANTTYYVRTDGNNANSGTANTAAGAWLTLQYAADYIGTHIDLGGYTLTVQVGDGTYAAGAQVLSPFVGYGWVLFQGNVATPANVVINNPSICFQATFVGSRFKLSGFKCIASVFGLYASGGGQIYLNDNMEFGACGTAHMYMNTGQIIQVSSVYSITGGAANHISTDHGGLFENATATTVTITGTPAFSSTFALASGVSNLNAPSMTFSGGTTGIRFTAQENSLIDTNGGGANYFPGTVAGGTATGGLYT